MSSDRFRQFYNYSDMVYSPAVCFTKISIIFLVLRIFCPKKRDVFYWVLQSLNLLNTIFYTIFFFIPIFGCRPRQKNWLKDTPGKCLQIFDLYIASAAFNVISDLAMYSAPVWKTWHLHMSKGKRLGISAIFATGGLWVLSYWCVILPLTDFGSAIIFAVSRLIFMILLLNHPDYSYIKMQGTILALSELASGIICSCLFVLPRLYRHWTASPPYNSEEYRLRKYKNITGREHLDDPYSRKMHHSEEQRNPWEHGIEGVPEPTFQKVEHI